jgi:G3E family GTPase
MVKFEQQMRRLKGVPRRLRTLSLLILATFMSQRKVPLSIISGFLGAGKSTFINYVLKEEHGKKIAVIRNEFGEDIALESAVILGPEGAMEKPTVVSLPNGCLCCSTKGDFLVAVENLVNSSFVFDYIFVEPSGLAEPGALASTFWVDEDVDTNIYLDGIITIVDAKHILRHLDEKKADKAVNEAERQIAFADRILLNKVDLVTPEELTQLTTRIRGINNMAGIYHTQYSRIDLQSVLHISAFGFQKVPLLPLRAEVESQCSCSDDEHDHSASHSHDHTVATVTVHVTGSVELHAFNSWLGSLLWTEQDQKAAQQSTLDIFRCKGSIAVVNDERKYILQGVHALFDLQPTDVKWSETEKRGISLMFIGRGILKEDLVAGLKKICR